MRRPIDSFEGKSREEIEAKERLLDDDNLEKGDRAALFLAALKTFSPIILTLVGIMVLVGIFL